MSKIIFSLIAAAFLSSCSGPKIESPVVYFSNASSEKIKNIECSWAGQNLLTLPALDAGDSRSQSFYISKKEEFFGLVVVSWRNSGGEKLVREFYFQDNNLPSIEDHTTYNYVQFYLDQEELEIVSSDAPDLAGKTRKMEKLLARLKAGHKEDLTATETSLIRVQHIDPQKTKGVPYWMNSSF
jgi:hypothetical protein